ncbi:MAG: hypothetical protein ABIH11_01785 [Candidatus Altiarchaeota archaeon]
MTYASRIPKLRGGRGQVFTWDLTFSAVLFLVIFSIVIYLWDSVTMDISGDLRIFEMQWLSDSVGEQLVKTPGYPEDWKQDTVKVYGLSDITPVGERVFFQDRIVDPDKLLNFIKNLEENYTDIRRSLLGSSRYDFYIVYSCINTSDVGCMQGIHLDENNRPVSCLNGFNFTITNHTTDTHIWIEAEDERFWGFNTTSRCSRGCSAGFMSELQYDGNNVKTVETTPGYYHIWVRGLSSSTVLQIVVDGEPFYIFNTLRGSVEWSKVGGVFAGHSIQLYFDNTDPNSLIDVVLLTTDALYDPRNSNTWSYGNPNSIKECIVGNHVMSDEVPDFVSSVKTASFSEPMDDLTLLSGKQRILKNTFKQRVVIWSSGRYEPIVSTTTTTTLSPNTHVVSCVGEAQFDCFDGANPVVVIDDVTVLRPLQCGKSLDITVRWHGNHNSDFNHWAFFLDDGAHYLDSCNSTNTTPEDPERAYNYDMICNVNVPVNLDAADGFHNLIVTAEDYAGYCTPEMNFIADAVYSRNVLLKGCISYTELSGFNPGGLKEKCIPGGTIDRIYWINVDGEPVTCGDVKDVSVYWLGTHGFDEETYWAFYLDNGTDYLFLDACKTEYVDADPTYYNMTCEVNFNNPRLADLTGNTYNFIVTGESDLGYCSKLGEADVADDTPLDWMPCFT